MSDYEITLNITFYGYNCNEVLHFLSRLLLMINISAQIIFFALPKLIEMIFIFSYSNLPLCQKSLETLHGSNANRLLTHFIP